MELKDIDKLFKDQQHSADEMPREEVWYRLEEKVDKMRPVSSKSSSARNIKYIAAAAIAFLFLASAYYVNLALNNTSSDVVLAENQSRAGRTSVKSLKSPIQAQTLNDEGDVADDNVLKKMNTIVGEETSLEDSENRIADIEEQTELNNSDNREVALGQLNSEISEASENDSKTSSSVISQPARNIITEKEEEYQFKASDYAASMDNSADGDTYQNSPSGSEITIAPPAPMEIQINTPSAQKLEVAMDLEAPEEEYTESVRNAPKTKEALKKIKDKRRIDKSADSTNKDELKEIVVSSEPSSKSSEDVAIVNEAEVTDKIKLEALEPTVAGRTKSESTVPVTISKSAASSKISSDMARPEVMSNARTKRYTANSSEFSWMEGKWSSESASASNVIQVEPDVSGFLTAKNYKVENGEQVLFEELKFKSDANGTKVLKKRAQTDSDYTHYLLVKSDSDKWTFIADNNTRLIVEKKRNNLYYHFETISGGRITSPKKFKKAN